MVFQTRQNTTVGQNNFLNILVSILFVSFLIKTNKQKNTSGNTKFPFTSVSLGLALIPFLRGWNMLSENILSKIRGISSQ